MRINHSLTSPSPTTILQDAVQRTGNFRLAVQILPTEVAFSDEVLTKIINRKESNTILKDLMRRGLSNRSILLKKIMIISEKKRAQSTIDFLLSTRLIENDIKRTLRNQLAWFRFNLSERERRIFDRASEIATEILAQGTIPQQESNTSVTRVMTGTTVTVSFNEQ